MLSSEYLARQSRRRWVVRIAVILLLLLAGTAGYAYLIEPNRLQVTRHRVTGPVRQPLKIAHITDLHTHGFGAREQTLVFLIRQQAPDLIVITGDTVDKGRLAPARDLLSNLSAPLGIWIVRGNWERWTLQDDEKQFYGQLGMRFLVNAGQLAREDLWIAGLDDPASGEPDLNKALAGAPTHAFKLVLLHAPDYFDQIAGRFDLALAGHTHGGQLVFPGLAPFWLPPGGKRYVKGWFSRNGSQLFVSRGVGTSIIPARLFARPELAIIEINPG